MYRHAIVLFLIVTTALTRNPPDINAQAILPDLGIQPPLQDSSVDVQKPDLKVQVPAPDSNGHVEQPDTKVRAPLPDSGTQEELPNSGAQAPAAIPDAGEEVAELWDEEPLPDLGAPNWKCDPAVMAKSKEVPKSVHSVRFADIKIVAALGDSQSAGNGANSSKLTSLRTEYRGLAFAIGGDTTLDEHITIPNILRKFNPDLFGYSNGAGVWNEWNDEGRPDLRFFAPDCFHFSKFGHSNFAKHLWNNMVQRVGAKSTSVELSNVNSPLLCPPKNCPLFPTKKNSRNCKKYLTPSKLDA
ncbi:unnamed protein product [Haemonchus placei]|uniref:SGNH_hydro domain-containing protein n=1 Tax=Haemonchus placei TaxID=6290 RepID=A0A158QPH0_HAEPC|nr:unnamed protein product [Haemonchus placei]